MGEDAVKGATNLRSSILQRTRALSVNQNSPAAEGEKSIDATITDKDASTDEALRESEGVLARLRIEAAKRLKDIQEAEDAADEALLKFGTNIRNFLRDAVVVAAPSTNSEGEGNAVLFESKDASGKRVIHTTRFDAQLHVIHTTLDSFTKDPASEEYAPWAKEFDAEKKTADIAQDLEKYEELRSSMEKLVPEQVEYVEFWKRYYFLRHSIETAEARRRDLLKGTSSVPYFIETCSNNYQEQQLLLKKKLAGTKTRMKKQRRLELSSHQVDAQHLSNLQPLSNPRSFLPKTLSRLLSLENLTMRNLRLTAIRATMLLVLPVA